MKMSFPQVTLAQRAKALLATATALLHGWLKQQSRNEIFQRRVDAMTGGIGLRRYY